MAWDSDSNIICGTCGKTSEQYPKCTNCGAAYCKVGNSLEEAENFVISVEITENILRASAKNKPFQLTSDRWVVIYDDLKYKVFENETQAENYLKLNTPENIKQDSLKWITKRIEDDKIIVRIVDKKRMIAKQTYSPTGIPVKERLQLALEQGLIKEETFEGRDVYYLPIDTYSWENSKDDPYYDDSF